MKCKNKRCHNEAQKHRRVCGACRHKAYKKKHRLKLAFYLLRSNARRRGKEFTLTLDDFRAFCERCHYLERVGIRSTSASIDRIDEERGYSADNIQCLTNAENRRKYHQYMLAKKAKNGLNEIVQNNTDSLE